MTTPYERRRQWWGYTNIGPVQIPPNPQIMVLTDRVTSIQHWVNYAPPTLTLVSTLPCNKTQDAATKGQLDPQARPYNNCVFYDAYDEPIIGWLNDSTFGRLVVSNGSLLVVLETYNKQRGKPITPPVYVMRGSVVGFGGNYAQVTLTAPGGNLLLANASSFLLLADGNDFLTLRDYAPGYLLTPFSITQTPNPPTYIPSFSQQYDD